MPRRGRLWLVLGVAAAVSSGLRASDDVRFGLCRQNIAEVALAPSEGAVSVQVRLTKGAAERFEKLTRRAQNRRLTVVVGEKVFSRAVVRGPVTSGTLVSPPLSGQEAARLAERVRQRRPDPECGPLPG